MWELAAETGAGYVLMHMQGTPQTMQTNPVYTDVCMEVGFSSLGTFSRTFSEVVGETPSQFRLRGPMPSVPSCFVKAWARPSSFGEAS